MNVLFYSRKGGQGKTIHAVGLALYKENTHFYTNDYGNATIETYSALFEEGMISELKPNDKLEVNEGENNVFDFGGFADKRIVGVAKYVDFCVVPIFFQSKADLTPAVQTILELEKYNKNVVILINNTEKEYIKLLTDALSKKFDHKIFVISRSKYINRLADEGKSVFELFNRSGLEKYMLRNLLPQIQSFYDYVSK